MANPFSNLISKVRSAFGNKPAQKRSYDGASVNRLTADWITSSTSTRTELRKDLKRLRARSRDLSRNDPYFKKFLSMVGVNVVGPHGIKLQVRARTASGELNKGLNAVTEAAFRIWGRTQTCTVTGNVSWKEAQRLFATTLARDGEVLVRKRYVRKTKANPFGFSLQFIDTNWLDEGYNQVLDTGRRIVMSVELDRDDKAVAYWLTPPGVQSVASNQRYRVRVPAEEIIHAYLPEEGNQTRGVPWSHAIMGRARMLDGYQEAELVAARAGACKGGFMKPPEEQSYDGVNRRAVESVEPGMIQELPPGYEFIQYDPNHPNANYPAYVQEVLQGIAAGLGVSYTSLTGDLSRVNFSSIRAGLLEERDVWRTLQQFVIEHFCDEVYTAWLEQAFLTGALELTDAEYEAVSMPVWQPRGWQWVDPLKDVQATVMAIDNTLATRTDALAEQGADFEEIVAVLAQEKEMLDAAGIDTTAAQAQRPAAQNPPSD